jgi:hypothetical protein
MERQLEVAIHDARKRASVVDSSANFKQWPTPLRPMKVRLETALAKLYLSECVIQSGLDPIRSDGDYGYTTEFEVESDLRDAIAPFYRTGEKSNATCVI